MHANVLKMLILSTKDSLERKTLMDQCDMLINPQKMGERFKLLAIRRFNFNTPIPGFIDSDVVYQ
jgi:SAM-dependent MidA family methyltransferase